MGVSVDVAGRQRVAATVAEGGTGAVGLSSVISQVYLRTGGINRSAYRLALAVELIQHVQLFAVVARIRNHAGGCSRSTQGNGSQRSRSNNR